MKAEHHNAFSRVSGDVVDCKKAQGNVNLLKVIPSDLMSTAREAANGQTSRRGDVRLGGAAGINS